MDLKKRLAQLDKLTRKDTKPLVEENPEAIEATQEKLDQSSSDHQSLLLATLQNLELEPVQNGDSECWKREYDDNLLLPASKLPDLGGFFTNAQEQNPTLDQILFLDTETTGLVGGTGTIAFLIGVSWFNKTGLHTIQYFLTGPGREAAILNELAELATRFTTLITYNGASFDLPLLRTRSRLNRVEDPFGELVSWDLLVPARRIWGRSLTNCRQQTLESKICNWPARTGDIEGQYIPQTWFTFLESGQPGLLPEVLHHNHLDMLGMADILREVTQAAELLATGPATDLAISWEKMWALGRICEKRQEQSAAISWFTAACGLDINAPGVSCRFGEPRFVADALRLIKRDKDWPLVEKIIGAALGAGIDEPWLHREAAILYEHRMVKLDKALIHALISTEEKRIERLSVKIKKMGNSCLP